MISKQIKENPLGVAEKIKAELLNTNIKNIDAITVTPPGFINFVIKQNFYQNNLKSIIQDKDNFGKGEPEKDIYIKSKQETLPNLFFNKP